MAPHAQVDFHQTMLFTRKSLCGSDRLYAASLIARRAGPFASLLTLAPCHFRKWLSEIFQALSRLRDREFGPADFVESQIQQQPPRQLAMALFRGGSTIEMKPGCGEAFARDRSFPMFPVIDNRQ